MVVEDVKLHLPAEHPAFSGHFPGDPIAPGGLLLALVCDALCARGVTPPARLSRVKFHLPVRPDQNCILRTRAVAGSAALQLSLRDAGGAMLLSLTYMPSAAELAS